MLLASMNVATAVDGFRARKEKSVSWWGAWASESSTNIWDT